MTKASFPWAYVIINAVWIFGLAVILAAFGWHDFLAHTRKRKLGELLRGESFLKPLYLGLTLVAGGFALSVSGVILAAGFMVASFGFIYVFIIKYVARGRKTAGDDHKRRQQALSAAGCVTSGLGDLSANHDKYPAEDDVEDEKKGKSKKT
jgi:hypothetical protein